MNEVYKVLIVDNEPFIVEELSEYLGAAGVSCVGCDSSAKAIELFCRDERIGVVLSDYRMPEINGIDLIKLLRKTVPASRVFESILFTGDADKDDVVAALRAGIADYYQKPLDLDALLAGVRELQADVQRRVAAQKVEGISERLKEMTHSLRELQQDVHGLNSSDVAEPVTAPELLPVTQLPGYSQLSPRQVEVAELLGKGLTNYQISCELGISENTVKLYVSQVLRATNMHNRTLLALALGGRR
ncbi:response regulator [Halopseudomonas bauzanensis]|uniref:response regulator n=1 Tax=Halopseudomonas bauzanensis TaxID=653930 RepID=UPI0035234035